MSFFFSKKREIRLLYLYGLAVFVHGYFANVNLPIVDVYWDVVFYKTMAFGLADLAHFELKNHIPVPILYPFLLSFGCYAESYRMIEWIHSWMNPAIYFLGFFPLYHLSRFLLNAKQSAAVCVLFLFYPSVIYTQWTVSENLAIPLTLFSAYYAIRFLVCEKPSRSDAIFLGIGLAALVLTRVQAVVIAAAVIGWILMRRWIQGKNVSRPILACTIAVLLIFCVWWGVGYLSMDQASFIYSEVNENSIDNPQQFFSSYFNRFLTHWTALWLEGALLVPALALFLLLNIWFFREPISQNHREMIYFLFIVSFAVVASIAWYRVMRIGIEPWSVSLRHVCYSNLLLLPVSVYAVGRYSTMTFPHFLRRLLMYLAIIIFLVCGFFFREAWDGLTHCQRYFCNSPSLDYMRQFSRTSVLAAGIFFLILSLCLGALCLRNRRWGLFVMVGLLLYIQGSEYDYMLEDQQFTLQVMNIEDVHRFCEQLEKGRWKGIPIYCQEDNRVQYLVPNFRYWLNRRANPLPDENSPPEKPYLYFTFEEQETGELVFRSGKARAYLYKK